MRVRLPLEVTETDVSVYRVKDMKEREKMATALIGLPDLSKTVAKR